MRHSFQVMEELGAECDRLGVRVVDVHGERGSASDFLATVARYIEAREKELHGRRWIPVTERLPEVHSPVLVSITESRYPTVATMSLDGEWLFREGDHVTVTHWMPLQAPPTDSK
jgi:hypothetical protein